MLGTVIPVIAAVVSDLPDLQAAFSRASEDPRSPVSLQDSLAKKQRSQLQRDIEQARTRLLKATVMFTDKDIDKAGYEFVRDKAQSDLQAATEHLEQLEQTTPVLTLPPLETVLAAANGWEAALGIGQTAAQREVLALLVERVEPVRIAQGKYSSSITWTPLSAALRVVVTEQGVAPVQDAA